MKRVVIFLVLVAVVVGGYFGYQQYIAPRQSEGLLANLQTIKAEEGDLVATIGATGIVRSNQSAQLTWQTSGTVEQVNVKAGDLTTTDQILASLSQTSLSQSIILAQADLVNAQKDLDNLLNSQLQQAQALAAVEEAEQTLEDLLNPELAIARASQAIADAEKAVELAERRVRNLTSTANQADIDAAEAQVVLAKDKLDKAQEKFDPYADKPEDNLTRAHLQSQLSAAQQEYDAAVRYLNSLTGTAAEIDITVAEADLATAQAQYLEAQREYERIKDGPTPADIELAEARVADAQREWKRIKDGPDPDDIAIVQARIEAAQAAIKQTSITAPFDGQITMVETIIGDQVNPGTLAFRLDDLSRLLVDVQVSEVDINSIKVGQETVLQFDAILNKEYSGVVTEVAAVGTTVQGVVEFTVTVEITKPDEDVKPGMTAAVNVVVNRLENILLVPNRAVRVQEGERVVYVMTGGVMPEAVPITLGASSETMSEVLDGDLEVGDLIVLNPPVYFNMNESGPPFSMGGN
jgi:HlyD family secretion protein